MRNGVICFTVYRIKQKGSGMNLKVYPISFSFHIRSRHLIPQFKLIYLMINCHILTSNEMHQKNLIDCHIRVNQPHC